MIKHLLLLVFLFVYVFGYSQTEYPVTGNVKDAASNETIVGAVVTASNGKAAATDIDGNYVLNLPDGEYTLTVSFVGFSPQKVNIVVAGQPVVSNFIFETKVLNEVEIVADVARARETPVAFSTISALKIQEELGSRDLPMLCVCHGAGRRCRRLAHKYPRF
jgi:iron complex outermembrane recepter protein